VGLAEISRRNRGARLCPGHEAIVAGSARGEVAGQSPDYLSIAADADCEPIWSNLKRSLANLTKQDIGQLTALIKTRLRRMQYGAETDRTRLPHVAHQLKRGFQVALGLALQWP